MKILSHVFKKYLLYIVVWQQLLQAMGMENLKNGTNLWCHGGYILDVQCDSYAFTLNWPRRVSLIFVLTCSAALIAQAFNHMLIFGSSVQQQVYIREFIPNSSIGFQHDQNRRMRHIGKEEIFNFNETRQAPSEFRRELLIVRN